MGAPLLCARGHLAGNAARIAELASAILFGGVVRFRVRKVGAWKPTTNLFTGMPERARASATTLTEREAEQFHADVRVGLISGSPGGKAFAPLSPLTVALHGKGKGVLRRSEQMLGEIAVIREGDTFKITVRGGRTRIADIHEGGRTFKRKLSRKQLRWLFAAMKAAGVKPGKGRKGGPIRDQQGKFISKAQRAALVGMTVIPPRPFFGPVYARYEKKVRSKERQMMSAWLRKIRGK